MSCEGGVSPSLISLVMKQTLISKPMRMLLFSFFQQKFSHLLGCWPFFMALTGFSHAFCHFWVPLMGSFCFSFSLPTGCQVGAYLRWLTPTLPQTNTLLLNAIPGGVSIFSSFMPRKANSSRPLAMQREPGSSPDTWGACLIPVHYGGNPSWP